MTTARCNGLLASFVACLVMWALISGAAFAQGSARVEPAGSENLMKVCGDRWRAVKDAEAARGTTWPQYLARCRAEAASARTQPEAVAPAAPSISANDSRGQPPAAPRTGRTAAQAEAQVPAKAGTEAGVQTGAPVFPAKVSERHASETPQRARQKTCSEQFQANKAANANGGLRWVEKGGGYWSKCNAHLKQTRV